MPIQPSTPIQVPAKTADALWVTSLNIIAPKANQPVRVIIRVAPYVTETQEIIDGQTKIITINDLYTAASEDAVLAQGVGGVFAAVQKLVQDRQLF